MAWDEVLAAIMGGLEGGVDGWQFARKAQQQERDRQAQQARQAKEDAYRDEQRRIQLEDRDLRLRDRARTETDQLLTSIGRGGALTDDQVAGARDVGLGHRVEDAPDFQHSYFTQAGPVPLMVPEVMTRVAPTAAERKADQVAAEKKRADDAARAAVTQAIEGLPAGPVRDAAIFGQATGKMPTFGVDTFEDPAKKQQREIDGAVAKEKALFPLKMRELAAREELQRKHAALPIPMRDDAALPRGVRAYLGDLVSRYQADPAAARAELQRATPNLLRDHPNLDLQRVTQQMNAMLPMPQLTDEERDAAAAERAAQKASAPPIVPPSQAPAAKLPIPLAGAPKPDARSAQASVLMQQIKQGRAQGQDTTALERQLLALKRGTNAAGVH